MGGIPVTIVNNGTPVVSTTRGTPVTLVDVHGNPEPVVPANGAIATDGQVIPVQGEGTTFKMRQGRPRQGVGTLRLAARSLPAM